MNTPAPREPGTLSPLLRTICGFNAGVWLWAATATAANGWSIASAVAGASMWALLAAGGNRPGWPRRAALGVAVVYLVLLGLRFAVAT